MASAADDPVLSLAFMRAHPAQAARVLESMAAAQSLPLFTRTPARLSAQVLAAMLPRRGAQVLEALDDTRALELLSAMPLQAAVALLRHLPETRRRALVAGLPTAAALASTLLLGYSEDTLGAWADPDLLVLPADTRTHDALERARQAVSEHAAVFVVDAHQRLLGIVGLPALLQAPAGATLASMAQRPVALLPAVAPLNAVAAHPGWQQSSVLPVVEPGDRLVGVLTHDALNRALRQAAAPAADSAAGGLPGVLSMGYWQALSGLLQVGLSLLPTVAPLAPVSTSTAGQDRRHDG
jgi:magnesium transporter